MSLANNSNWQAALQLGFSKTVEGKTRLSHRAHRGPLVVQKPLYPETNGCCHIYLLHPPGGVVGGDGLQVDIEVQARAHSLITTPGAGKFYRSEKKQATIAQNIKVKELGLLEWLPQENIVFDKSYIKSQALIELETDARLVAWDIVCLGRPAASAYFETGSFEQSFQLSYQNRPLLIERALYTGGTPIMSAPWGLNGKHTIGTLLIFPANQRLLEKIRQHVTSTADDLFSATLMNQLLVCRYLGNRAEHAKRKFSTAWSIAREQLIGEPAHTPRIWAT